MNGDTETINPPPRDNSGVQLSVNDQATEISNPLEVTNVIPLIKRRFFVFAVVLIPQTILWFIFSYLPAGLQSMTGNTNAIIVLISWVCAAVWPLYVIYGISISILRIIRKDYQAVLTSLQTTLYLSWFLTPIGFVLVFLKLMLGWQ